MTTVHAIVLNVTLNSFQGLYFFCYERCESRLIFIIPRFMTRKTEGFYILVTDYRRGLRLEKIDMVS